MKEVIINTIIKVCSYDELPADDQRLTDVAREAAKKSYAPYSHFNVGAAVRLAGGEVVCGSNQENAAYPSGLCAERTTLFYAGAQHPDKAVEAIAIAARNEAGEVEHPIVPCGACRQVMLETETRFAQPMRIILYGAKECYIIEGGTKELLPLSFGSDFLR
ncbi:MAG: cytidine deaminase [Bacteroidaceae bacterium]|nr:cytidine deaminase [Bacteroidaceae bacterium]